MGGPRLVLADPEVRARATSGTTIEVIDARLAAIADRPECAEERAFLISARGKLAAGA